MKKILCLCVVCCVGVTFAGETFLGDLPTDGTPVSSVDSLAPYALDYYHFTLTGDINNGDGTFLNIQTYGSPNFNLMDTEIGLYDAGGFLVSDDDGNADGPYTVFYSLLTFGDSDPLGTNVDTTAGADGLLSAGDYTLVVGGYNTDFTSDINNIRAGRNSGDYIIQFTSSTVNAIPAPGAVLLGSLGIGMINFLRRRKTL